MRLSSVPHYYVTLDGQVESLHVRTAVEKCVWTGRKSTHRQSCIANARRISYITTSVHPRFHLPRTAAVRCCHASDANAHASAYLHRHSVVKLLVCAPACACVHRFCAHTAPASPVTDRRHPSPPTPLPLRRRLHAVLCFISFSTPLAPSCLWGLRGTSSSSSFGSFLLGWAWVGMERVGLGAVRHVCVGLVHADSGSGILGGLHRPLLRAAREFTCIRKTLLCTDPRSECRTPARDFARAGREGALCHVKIVK